MSTPNIDITVDAEEAAHRLPPDFDPDARVYLTALGYAVGRDHDAAEVWRRVNEVYAISRQLPASISAGERVTLTRVMAAALTEGMSVAGNWLGRAIAPSLLYAYAQDAAHRPYGLRARDCYRLAHALPSLSEAAWQLLVHGADMALQWDAAPFRA